MTPSTNPASTQAPKPLVRLTGEYRYAKTDGMTFPARDNRPARTVKRAIHTIEIQDRSLELTEVLPDSADLATWKSPWTKGTQVTVDLDLEPAEVLTVQNGRPQKSRGLWRVRVLAINAATTAK